MLIIFLNLGVKIINDRLKKKWREHLPSTKNVNLISLP